MKYNNELTYERLKEVVNYDPETGIFTWKIKLNNNLVVGSIAGTLTTRRHIRLTIDGNHCQAHRLAWLYVYGEWPEGDVDHINNIRTDNRIENLRLATKSQNGMNCKVAEDNKSGVKGVCWDQRLKRWRAYVTKEGKTTEKRFKSFEEAAEYVKKLREELCGEFTRHE